MQPYDPQQLQLKDAVTFHIAEFTALRGEILEDLKAVSANFQYAATLSGGVAAWLLAPQNYNAFLDAASSTTANFALRGTYWVPFLFSSLLAGLTLTINIRFGIKGGYLKRLENAFGFEGFGWQKTWKDRGSFGPGFVYIVCWIVLIILDFSLGLFGLFRS